MTVAEIEILSAAETKKLEREVYVIAEGVKSEFFFITAWEVAHDRKNHYPHISLRDTLG